MCLDGIDYKLIEKLPNKIKAWKVLKKNGRKLVSDIQHYPYKRGVNVCKTNRRKRLRYVPRFHVFKFKKDANDYGCSLPYIIVPVYINKKDITAMGTRYIFDYNQNKGRHVIVIVTKKLTIKREDYNAGIGIGKD